MGLIRAALSAATGNLADQWKEFFYCDSMDRNVLMTKGTKKTSGFSSNKFGSDNIITNGSGIAVADGQCMIIVDQGKIVELCAEPGEYTFDQSSEPTIFKGDLKESIMASLDNMLKRFSFGGDTAHDQRVYYFNTKEIIDNKFGTPNPVPFRLVDERLGLDIDVAVRCAGVYSYKITDPVLFYMNVCGNVPREYRREELDTQLKAEFISALQPCFGRLSQAGMRPNELVNHVEELAANMNEVLSYLKEGEILTSSGKDRFVMKGDRIFCYIGGTRFSMGIEDFAELYMKNRFYLYEESVEIDESKDEAYYRYYRT